jgi:hypothetical protein
MPPTLFKPFIAVPLCFRSTSPALYQPKIYRQQFERIESAQQQQKSSHNCVNSAVLTTMPTTPPIEVQELRNRIEKLLAPPKSHRRRSSADAPRGLLANENVFTSFRAMS